MKPFFVFAAVFITSSSIAQSSLDALIQDFERNKAMCISYVEAMPENQFDFKPTPDVRSFAEQFLHISQGLVGLASNGTGSERIFGTENLEQNDSYKTKQEVLRILSESFDHVISSVGAMDPATFDEIIQRGQFNVSRIGWVNKALEHSTHHKGQAAVYLRMNGIQPAQFQLF